MKQGMKMTANDVRALTVIVVLGLLALLTDVDKSLVLGYMIGLTESSPLENRP